MVRPSEALSFGIDIGSSNTKVVAITHGALAVAELRVITFHTPDRAAGLLRLVQDAVAALVAELGQPVAVGVASMAESGVAVDAAGSALTDIVRWDGTVTSEALRLAVAGDDPRGLHRTTGIAPSAKVPLVLWAQLRSRHPALWRRVAGWLGVADLVVHALTGERVTDHTLALRSMAVRRPARLPLGGLPLGGLPLGGLAFDPALLDRVGLRPAQLPEIVGPGEWGGRALTRFGFGGLAPGIPAVVAGHDHAVAAWAVGARSPGAEVDSFGTSEAVVRLFAGSAVPPAAFDEGMSVGVDVDGACSTLIAGSASSGRVLAEWARLSGAPAPAASTASPTASPTAPPIASAASIGSAASTGSNRHAPEVKDGPAAWPSPAPEVVLPYLTGRQCPCPDPAAQLTVAGEDAATLSPERIRALTGAMLDGLALHAEWMRVASATVLGDGRATPSEIVLVGGDASRADGGLRRRAAAFGAPVRAVNVSEPVACGAAMLAAFRVAATRARAPGPAPTLPLGAPVVPPASAITAYAEAFSRFRNSAIERTP